MESVILTHGKRIFQEYAKGIFQEYAKRGKTTHTLSIAKLTSMPKYIKIQKKSLLQRLLKMS